MTNEEYVTKILERVGPIIDVVGLFLVVKKIQDDEREECAKICDAVAQTMEEKGEGPTGYISWVEDCADKIRNRMKKND